jgi:myo-inositol 2-dehydrogenase/D-chiro-inositol 1-dehydrogenase
MSDNQYPKEEAATRRDFLKVGAAAAGSAVLASASPVHAAGSDVIRVGFIGCGHRGTGAMAQCLRGGPNVKLVAMADVFRDQLDNSLTLLRNDAPIRDKLDVPPARQFIGLDAYEQVFPLVDLVVLTTPPGFRPIHLRAAVAAGKHAFAEKPLAVDAPGVRTVLEAYEEATRRRLSCVAGTQRRYQTGYRESMQRIHDGQLGTITSARCYWNGGTLWHRGLARAERWTDLEWHIRNWMYFTWLSGDHIVEQHIHNLDVMNWALGGHPLKALSLGGRQVRIGPQFGNVYDHFATDFEYPGGVHVMSQCRQMVNCDQNVSETVVGTRGTWTSKRGYQIIGERPWIFGGTTVAQRRRADNEPYQAEHVALIESIRNGRPINDLKNAGESTLTGIMARMSAYTGREVTWEQAMESRQSLMPPRLDMHMTLPVPAVAMPGRTPLV